ncbi:MAG: discoidin domain-containing protein, partial [Planctomycetes bacterium]|nr:discoidin domain-containing protein [Planctomycetota bacterium]
MSKKLIYLMFVVLVLALAGTNVAFGQIVWEGRISSADDDMEQYAATGAMDPGSSDLEITEEGSPGSNQVIGLRFINVHVPQGATITNAYVQFHVDETSIPGDNRPGTKFLRGEAVDNAAPISTTAPSNLSSRPTTSAEASWDWPFWTTTHEEGPDQRTSDISAVIEEIVGRPGWSPGNSLLLIITGSGENTAEAFEGEPDSAALLHIEYTLGKAARPSPADGTIDVPRDVILSWKPGVFAAPVNGHKFYFSENFNDVNDGIGAITQSASNYTPPQRLDFSTTYYWRADEVNNVNPDSPWIGSVWSFTTELFAYPIDGNNITATASSTGQEGMDPENTINGSGLDVNDLHSTEAMDMWISDTEPNGAWIEYEFDKVHKLHEMWVWNSNQTIESIVGLGIKAAAVEYSVDGNNWTALGDVPEFSQAPGAEGYAANTTVDFAGAAAKYVKITANSNWGGILAQYGLSEVRFSSLPVWTREPDPASGTSDVDVDNVTLSWRAGREAASHEVHLSTDEQAVIDSNALAATVSETSYDTGELELGVTYYWKVNEVNEAETPTTWQGDISNFSTQEYLVVETFENYNDISPDRMFETWIDGIGYTGRRGNGSGAIVGYIRPPYAEQSIVHGDKQSMALFYDNSSAAGYSEATANVGDLAIDDVPVDRNWAKHGIKTLSLWFYGDPSNAAEQMYVKVNGSKVLYDGDATNLTIASWQPWNIELADFGVDLSKVTELGIGFERSGETGGSGMVYFDDIRLYSYSRQFITPAEPNQTGLVGHYEFEGNTNDSATDNHGTVSGGNPIYVEGKIGGAMKFH